MQAAARSAVIRCTVYKLITVILSIMPAASMARSCHHVLHAITSFTLAATALSRGLAERQLCDACRALKHEDAVLWIDLDIVAAPSSYDCQQLRHH